MKDKSIETVKEMSQELSNEIAQVKNPQTKQVTGFKLNFLGEVESLQGVGRYKPVFYFIDSEGEEFEAQIPAAWIEQNVGRVFEGDIHDDKVWIKLN